MSTIQIKTELSFAEFLKAVEQLSLADLEQLMSQVMALQAQRQASKQPDDEREAWLSLSAAGLEAVYGENEVEYSLDLIKEPNPDYEGR